MVNMLREKKKVNEITMFSTLKTFSKSLAKYYVKYVTCLPKTKPQVIAKEKNDY